MKKVTFITIQAPWTHTYLQQDLVGVPNEAFEGQISECILFEFLQSGVVNITSTHTRRLWPHLQKDYPRRRV